MNAEALTGAVLGTCKLQKLLGQGGMGAVFLAQQAQPSRQVAVKVLLSILSQNASQRNAFLARFRREIDAIASLKHPHIVSIYEHGERDSVTYLVMPYLKSGTLRTVMEMEMRLPFAKMMDYLDQLATALDFASERGVMHGNVRPANILLNAEGQLLLSDFGLMKIATEGMTPQARLTGAGLSYITPEYMAPELVQSESIDASADRYALGVLTYQMVTGTTPFHGESAMQLAAQHIQSQPPSPRRLRPDLPLAAEEVIFRALAKRPSNRYNSAKDFVDALRTALTSAGIALNNPLRQMSPALNPSASGLFQRSGLFSSPVQTGSAESSNVTRNVPVSPLPTMPTSTSFPTMNTGNTGMNVAQTGRLTQPASRAATSGDKPRLGHKPGLRPVNESNKVNPAEMVNSTSTGVFPPVTGTPQSPQSPQLPQSPDQSSTFSFMAPTPGVTRVLPNLPDLPNSEGPGSTDALPGTTRSLFNTESPLPDSHSHTTGALTGALMVPGDEAGSTTSMMKLAGAVKVVQVPVAGQPGRYMTGLLPVLPVLPESPLEDEPSASPQIYPKKRLMTIALAALALIVVIGSISFGLSRLHSGSGTTTGKTTTRSTLSASDLSATANAQASATAQANIILSDPLDQSLHNWKVVTSGTQQYFFQDGAYHILNNDQKNSAYSLLPRPAFTGPLAYSLTIKEIKGDDSSLNNTIGMIFDFNINSKGKRSFYIFELVNKQGGEYQFWKYDESTSNGPNNSPWKEINHYGFGKEFRGSRSSNTVKITMHGKNFNFNINGKSVGNAQDGALTTGLIGMWVNLKGTEVAFSNLQITRN